MRTNYLYVLSVVSDVSDERRLKTEKDGGQIMTGFGGGRDGDLLMK